MTENSYFNLFQLIFKFDLSGIGLLVFLGLILAVYVEARAIALGVSIC